MKPLLTKSQVVERAAFSVLSLLVVHVVVAVILLIAGEPSPTSVVTSFLLTSLGVIINSAAIIRQ